MKSAARNVPQPFQVAAKSKWVLFEVPATWKGCGTFSEESTEITEHAEECESGKFLNCLHLPIFFDSACSVISVLSLCLFCAFLPFLFPLTLQINLQKVYGGLW
jgi:hypothetical protein